MTDLVKYQTICRKYCYAHTKSQQKNILVAIFLFFIPYLAFAQTTQKTIKIDLKDTSISQVFNSIEKQSNYSFFYNNDIDVKQKVSVKITSDDIHKIIAEVLKNTSLGYRLSGQRIVLFVKQETKQSKQTHTVSGVISDASGPVIGASVVTKDGKGTITSMNGDFQLASVHVGDVLTVSYVGYTTQKIVYNGESKLNIAMKEDATELEQVVVTALGIKRAEKALTYNIQQVKSDELTTVKSANFMNSLIGKVAGVNINTSASGPGGGVKVVMRGIKSISQNNNALYVIDGIPMYNRDGSSSSGPVATQSSGSESIADINPDDIESMSLLTGPSAAALYGYEGANGVVLITTKKGRIDQTTVTFSNNTTFSNPLMMPKFQNTYGNASGDVFSWGEPTDYRFDPAKFFNTGSNVANTLSLATGNDKSQTYLSASINKASGILPNNDYERYNFLFRNTTQFLNNKFILDTSANYIIQSNKNMVSQGQYHNPLPALYLFPRGEDFGEIETYKRFDESMETNGQYWPYDTQGLSLQNPYWIMNCMNRDSNRKRYKLSASLQYLVTDWLNFQGRVNIDNTEILNTEKMNAGTYATFAGTKGRYQEAKRTDRQVYADVLANITKRFGDFSITANIGASIKDIRSESSILRGDLKHVTNKFTIENLDRNGYYGVNANGTQQQTQSIFANTELGWKSFLYLNMTIRNDWDSALAFSTSKPSFSYPSVGLSSIISEVVKLPTWFSFLKARFSYTSVGNSYDTYLTRTRYVYDEQLDQYKMQSIYPNQHLKPEITKSYEAGLNMRFLKGTVNFDLTYYHSDTRNQTFSAPLSSGSGYTSVYVQGGSVQNQGIEIALGYNNKWRDFGWTSNFTFTQNENKVKRLANGITNIVTGESIEMPYINKATLGEAGAPVVRLTEGGTMGDIYINREFKRDNNGYIYIDPKTKLPSIVNTEYKKIGSLLPKVNLGWKNSFSYKGVRLNVLLTGRFGGMVVSNTQAFLDRFGVSEYSAKLRETGLTINNQSVPIKEYLETIAAGSGQGDFYVYDATNIRLQEVSLEYTLSRKYLHNIADVTLGLIGNNLGMIYCKAPFDPELVASASSTFYTGVDYFMQPSLRNIGFSVKLQF